MKETQVKIKTNDGHIIYGTLTEAKKKSDKLVIFIHGFIGDRDQHIFFNGSKYFAERGFDAFRFDLYTEGKKARHFKDTSLRLHGQDTTEVVRFFKKKYSKIYLAGHSFGGTTLLFTDTSLVNALVFWDASYVGWGEEEKKFFLFRKNLKSWTVDWGITHIVGKKFVEDLKKFPGVEKLIPQIHKPVKFITAGSAGNEEGGKVYFVHANKPKALVNIKTADHNFNNFKDEERLFKETFSWIKKFS